MFLGRPAKAAVERRTELLKAEDVQVTWVFGQVSDERLRKLAGVEAELGLIEG